MASIPRFITSVADAVNEAVSELICVQHCDSVSFVSLPMFGPDGSPVTVRVTRDMAGFQIDDAGATYQELDRLGMGRSFSATAPKVIEHEDISISNHMIVAFADGDDLGRAISDVGSASWNILEKIYKRLGDTSEDDLAEDLRDRLANIFGSSLEHKQQISGASSSEWSVSAIVNVDGKIAVFQAVTDHANSVYRASAAFHDLASLPKPPALIAVVKDREELGPKLGLLAQVARVIEDGQPDDIFRRSVA